MGTLALDARRACRVLARNPGPSLLAILCLGLGIGLHTTMFAGADPWLFRPLPYAAPDQLLGVREVSPQGTMRLVSPPTYFSLKDESASFAEVAAVVRAGFNLSTETEPERVDGALITPSLFPMLGVRAAEGRLFAADEGRPGGPSVCLVGDDLWRRRLGGKAGVVGSTLKIDGEVYTIVGRMPPGWAYPEFAQLWTPLGLDPTDRDRTRRGLDVVARLRSGLSVTSAGSEVDSVVRRLDAESPETSAGWGVRIMPLLEENSPPGVRSALHLMLAAAAFVLLIACANVANLLLAQAIDRRREIATRLALGASGGQLLRERLFESLLLAVAGGALGVPLARVGTALLAGAMPVRMPFWAAMTLNPRVLAVTLASCAIASVAAGLLPALEASRLDVRAALQDGGRGSTAGVRSRALGSALVAAELAASVVLLSSALLMIRSFYERQRFDVGFEPEGALLARLTLTGERYRDAGARAVFLDECVRRAHTLPGVESAAALTALPFSDEFGGGWSPDSLDVDGIVIPEAARPSVLAHATTAGGLAALGIAVPQGRDFQESEVTAGADVAVISEEVAHRYWPEQDPLGRRIRVGAGEWLRVIGVAREVREPSSILGLDLKPHGQVYVPYRRRPSATVMLVVRGRDPGALAGALRREVRSLDPHLPLYDTRTLVEARRTADWVARLWGQMLAWAAAIGTFLACVGVYGVVSRSVARRTSEIGVRMAMGADRRAVLRLVLGQGLRLSLAGIAAGLLGALVLTRALASLLYGVSTADPFSLLGSSLALGGIAVLATYFPARRATGVNPIVALRSE